ncbi:hypothetical protein BU16DRAFT_566113 [Lophium mytilinum]|uniref:2EXR domain-containing protein n=1 Tax=Lophium mytilinum TaxID=390894 RepID=A0A6A6QIA8_9PEZI|nr:hypothetical protein BU16DRAFT_566113 [Lophium mytilinum]
MPRGENNMKEASSLSKTSSGRVVKKQYKAWTRPTRMSGRIARKANAGPLITFHPFLQLPQELRDMVYEHAIPMSHHQPMRPREDEDDKVAGLALLQVNKQVSQEASAALERTAAVNLEAWGDDLPDMPEHIDETVQNGLLNYAHVNIEREIVWKKDAERRDERGGTCWVLSLLRRHLETFVSGSAQEKWIGKKRWVTVYLALIFHQKIFEKGNLSIEEVVGRKEAEDHLEDVLNVMKSDKITQWTIVVDFFGNLAHQSTELQLSVNAFKTKCEAHGFKFNVRDCDI